MLYPKNLEQKLGFDQIREWIKQECSGTLGKAFVEKMRFSNDYDMIDKLVRQTAEMKTIMLLHVDEFPSSNFIDAVPHLAKSAIEGMFLTEEEFFEIKLSLRTIYDCLIFFKNQEENVFPQLKELTQAIDIDSTLLKDIDRVIDQRGKLRDDASPELQAIRRQIIAEQANLRKKLESILKQSINQGYTSDDASATIRNGRMVIPVAAEHKRKIKGFIQDESATGQTIYLEPVEIFDLNNEITELGYREKREIIRILTHLTDRLRPHVPNLKKAYTFLGLIDFIRAKAKFALRTQANLPIFSKKTILIWENTRHPLLYLSFQKQGKSVIPLSIKLEEKQRILVISGPNAGGKSIALKTVGLTQYMFQCGLLVCMDDHSQIGLFRDIFIDIGDEQSLENDLSTYSSHLTNMKYFLQHADKNTLFLIDEFGTGTEPGMGGAIAETILDALQQKKAFGVLNTHYGNLKAYANRTEGVANAAMRFDAEHLEPLYQLEIGRPGSSFAFEIAQKIGLPREIVTKSKQKVGTTQVDFDKMLRELETEKQKFAEQNRELQAKEKTLNETLAKYSTLKNELETGRKQLLNKAKEDARRLVKDANQKIETTIREIREVKAEKDLTKMLRQDLADFEKKLKPEDVVVELETAPEIKVIGGTIEEGDLVRIKGQNTVGEVLSIKGKDAEIRIGELKSNVKINRLEKISRKEYRQQTVENQPRMQGIDMNEKMANFSTQLDLRGKRGEEALTEVDAWIDQGIMLGSSELRIVHGKGDGILRNLIRNHLRRYREIASMNDEHADRGGSGVTIIKMK
ncbi:endonuclease MutS2 [Xanthocytophaga agilis]|uniref:Endonuclease MutS2 n=1 Tax=Xanthocytophaga agilis TaxID=3048010 RepID=A0AAE3RAN3_9BACT|nr:endonuclease MutS2 [Xanthocytophaga agilis]MDJ1503872.1 endonuclease MutS2 [Xanthocytophaga agilis]